jgi:lysophospholipase L1-like esterase
VSRLFLLVSSSILALLLAEATVRLTRAAPALITVAEGRYQLSANPRLGYVPTPGVEYHGEELWNYDWRGETTRLGYRGRDYPFERTPGALRIAVLGDSIALGLWIDSFDQSFPGVLEVSLHGRGIAAEVLSFGVVGYNTAQEVETLKTVALRYSPDLVILAYCLNDRERNDGALLARLQAQAGEAGGPSRHSLGAISERSELARFLLFRVLPRLGVEPPLARSDDEYRRLNEDTVEEALREFGEVVAKAGTRGVVAIFPHLDDVDRYAFHEEHQRIAAAAAHDSVLVLDLLPAFRACARPGVGLGFDPYHPNELGHRCAGEALAELVAALRTGPR